MQDLDDLLTPERCVFGLPDHEADEELNELGLEFTVTCSGPTSGECSVEGRDAGRIVRVEAMSWEDGHRLINELCGVLVSTRWCCSCGLHTRIWLLCDGSLLFSHDWEYYDGAHRVVFDEETSRKLRQLWSDVRTSSVECRCPSQPVRVRGGDDA